MLVTNKGGLRGSVKNVESLTNAHSGCSVVGEANMMRESSHEDHSSNTMRNAGSSETNGHPPPGSNGHHPPLSNGHPPAMNNGYPTAVSNGHPSAMNNGHPPALSNGHPPAMNNGHPPALSNGHPPALSNGHTPAVSNGHPPAVSNGHPPAVSNGQPPALSNGQPPPASNGHPSLYPEMPNFNWNNGYSSLFESTPMQSPRSGVSHPDQRAEHLPQPALQNSAHYSNYYKPTNDRNAQNQPSSQPSCSISSNRTTGDVSNQQTSQPHSSNSSERLKEIASKHPNSQNGLTVGLPNRSPTNPFTLNQSQQISPKDDVATIRGAYSDQGISNGANRSSLLNLDQNNAQCSPRFPPLQNGCHPNSFPPHPSALSVPAPPMAPIPAKPTAKRTTKRTKVPEEEKDEKYLEKRAKNNLSARNSRANSKAAHKAVEEELKQTLNTILVEQKMRHLMASQLQSFYAVIKQKYPSLAQELEANPPTPNPRMLRQLAPRNGHISMAQSHSRLLPPLNNDVAHPPLTPAQEQLPQQQQQQQQAFQHPQFHAQQQPHNLQLPYLQDLQLPPQFHQQQPPNSHFPPT